MLVGVSTSAAPSRRERLRAEALAEIREHAYAQIAAGGPTALSLNGIAKAMGMSGPGMYRYFPSRDALLTTLVTESHEAVADALEGAFAQAARRTPAGRVRAVLHAYRAWAVASPHRYRLVYGSTYGAGALDPERIVPAAQRSMAVFLDALAGLASTPAPRVSTDAALARQLAAWDASRTGGAARDPQVLRAGVLAWTRLHGVISLEIEGDFAQMGLDPVRLYDAEIDELLAGQ